MNKIEAIKYLKRAMYDQEQGESYQLMHEEALEMAVQELEKAIPKKVVIERWSPALCPCCECELSESVGDGYYKHYEHLEVCPKCRQILHWDK